jgi:hypothetical protein
MTTEESNTVYAADSILMANPKHLAMEMRDYPACLLELVEVCIEHLTPIRAVGIGGRIIDLEILKKKLQKILLPSQSEML